MHNEFAADLETPEAAARQYLETLLALGRLCRDRGLNGGAAAAFRKILEVRPNNAEATAELRTLPLGDISSLRGLGAQA
jgi:Flp pilus assembly protein TadD